MDIIKILFLIAAVGGWLTHVVRCVDLNYAAFLIVGMILPPVGVLHGWWAWFQ